MKNLGANFNKIETITLQMTLKNIYVTGIYLVAGSYALQNM